AERWEVSGGRDRGRGNHADEGRAAFLAGGLNVALGAEHPAAELEIVAPLDAADDTVEVLVARDGAGAKQGRFISRRAPAVANVGTQVESGPAVDRRRWRQLVERSGQVGGE